MTELHPRGTLRARFEATDPVDAVFRRLGIGARRCDLGDQGLYLAEEIVAADRWLGGSDPEALGFLALALMIALRQGSTRLPLDGPGKGYLRTLVSEIVQLAETDRSRRDHAASNSERNISKIMKRIANLTAVPSFNSVIGSGGARLPLVVDDGHLYSERMRHLEVRVAAKLAARILAAPVEAPPRLVDCESDLTSEQRQAVELALSGSLTVITGGPGTGKTRVAAAIVLGFAGAGIAGVAVAAPTGKAANRLTEVLASPDHAPVIAQTIHRLLGHHGHHVVHNASNPLPVGALIIDEASMVDLDLMAAVLEALPDSAPLVLIGDAHQLPAVEAGKILSDLASLNLGGRACVATIEHSHRMDAADPRGRQVLDTARAIHRGEGQRITDRHEPIAVARTPGTLTFSGSEWVDAVPDGTTARAVAAALWHRYGGAQANRIANDTVFRFEAGSVVAEQASDLEALWSLLTQARLLTVTRGLPTGSIALNAYLHQLALDRMTLVGTPEFVPGEPVMITANDYQRGLWNGDQGIIIRAEETLGPSAGPPPSRQGRHHRYRALFRTGGKLVPFAIEALRDRIELAWALTIHKSQGSEFDAVAMVLPDDDLPLLTRELIYTGITRARTSVVLCGSRTAIHSAAKRVALRHSGLADRIRATVRCPPTRS